FPTPTIGMLGVLERVEDCIGAGFPEAGLAVLFVAPMDYGDPLQGLGGSEYLAVVHGLERGIPPALDLQAEKSLHRFLVQAARQRLIRSAHDLSEGGFAVALAECALIEGIGARVQLPSGWGKRQRLDAQLFGEAPTRVILSAEPAQVPALQPLAAQHHLACHLLGYTGGDQLVILQGDMPLIQLTLADCQQAYARIGVEAMSEPLRGVQ
ncbi:MAG: AIR synthase-related protein, partial [Fimbriimonadales bacterium]|nr:AIR synthase-related protein [Fimbriimonadales bacterium]